MIGQGIARKPAVAVSSVPRDEMTGRFNKDYCSRYCIPDTDVAASHRHELFCDVTVCHNPPGWIDKETGANDRNREWILRIREKAHSHDRWLDLSNYVLK